MGERIDIATLARIAVEADESGDIEPLCEYVFRIGTKWTRYESRKYASLFMALGVLAYRVAQLEAEASPVVAVDAVAQAEAAAK